MSLKGKRALVTGSSRGIGRACAVELARRGARVAVHYNQDRDGAEKLAAELGGDGKAPVLQADVADPAQIEKMFDSVKEAFGGLDILVNNAGQIAVTPGLDVKEDEWRQMLDVNARSALLCSQRAAPLMTGGGAIVNLSTELTERVLPGCLSYSIAKTAVEVVTRHLAVELGPQGIVVNAVAPGLTETDMGRPFLEMEGVRDGVLQRTPAGRIGQPEDIAKIVAFLVSPDAFWLRGQTLVANGGGTLG